MAAVRATKRSAGFTLTELLVVLLLVAVFTGVMVAEMRGTFEDALLRGTAREVMAGLSLASSRAVTLNQPHAFRWEVAGNRFTVYPMIQPIAAPSGEPQKPSLEERKLDARIKVEIRHPEMRLEQEESPEPLETREQDVVRFFPDGTADQREIVLRDPNGIEMILRINPITGRVRIQDTKAELP